jgi:hypothetical protein
MIALFLIMISIIFGIYLFRTVSQGTYVYLERRPVVPTAKDFPNKSIVWEAVKPDTGSVEYDVWALEPASEEGKKLAQQLITTIGTLVVAVSSFYFGGATATSAAKKERERAIRGRSRK